MSIVVLRNPTSGRGEGARRWPAIERELHECLGDGLQVVTPSSANDLADQARRLVEEGASSVLVAAGGDGTVNAVMQAVLGSSCALGILPLGTGNDFARTIGVDLGNAVATLAGNHIETIDVGRWRQGDRSGHFLNVAGCGFDAAVASRINRGVRHLRGRAAYLYAVVATLAAYRPIKLDLSIDGEPLIADAMLCAIANAQSYGAGMRIAPTAELQDGKLDLVVVGALGRAEFLRNIPKVFKGEHLAHPKVMHRCFEKLWLSSEPPTPFLVDGELLPEGPVTVEVVPKALRVVTPPR